MLHSLYTDETVRRRLLDTLGYFLLYLVGLNILLPFVSAEMVSYPGNESNGSLADLLNIIQEKSSFVHNTSILALGAMAYYMASVIVFLITPFLFRERAGKEQSIRQLVKVFTLIIATKQAFSYSHLISYWFLGGDTSSYALGLTWIALVSGALICMWIADRISDQGLLDGRILLICVALFSTFPSALIREVSNKLAAGKLLQLGMEIGIWFFIVAGIIALSQAVRYLPLKLRKDKEAQLENPVLRTRLNMVDEYPLYLALQLVGLPLLVLESGILADTDTQPFHLLMTLADPTSLITLVLTFSLTMLLTYVVMRMVVRPKPYLEFVDQWNAELSDVSAETSDQAVLRSLFDRLTFPLAVALAVIGILPGLMMLVFGMEASLASYFGGFSLFLIVSLLTDFFSKLEQTATDTSSIVGRSTTPDLNLVYELEVEFDEEE